MPPIHRIAAVRRTSLSGLLLAAAVTSCTASEGSFTLQFAWQGGSPPPNLPANLFMYATITAPGSSAAIATAGPNPYAPGASLPFSTVPNGTGLIVNARLLDAPGSAAQVVAYGISAPFSLEPGKNVTVTVALALHGVVALPPASDGPAITVLSPGNSGQVASSTVSLELLAGTGAVGARISNFPALPPGGGTKDVPALTADSAARPPAGYQAFRYDGWDLDAGLTACPAGTLCQRQVYVYFTDANGVASPTASASVLVNRLTPALVAPKANPDTAKVGEAIAIAATPSEPLAQAPVAHVYAAADTQMMTEVVGFFTLQPGSRYAFDHVVVASDTDGAYFATFDLVDEAGNKATVGQDGSISFTVESTTPVISNILTSAGRFSAVPPYNQLSVGFDCSESLDAPPALLNVTVGQYPMTCGTFQSGSPNYTCNYTVLGTELAADGLTSISSLPEANLPVLISALNGIGNEGAGDASVVFDFMRPSLVSALPSAPAVGVGQVESLVLTPSEALQSQSAPVLSISPGPFAFQLVTGTTYTFQHTVMASDVSGTYMTSLAMTDLVGNQANAAGPTFMVDTVVPRILNPSTGPLAFSAVTGHNTVTLTFGVSKTVSTPTVWIGGPGTPMVYQPQQSQAPDYTYTYAVTGSEAPGPQSIVIQVVDDAGNFASSLVTVTFDFTPPVLSAVAAPNPANASALPILSISSSKPLPNPPQIVITPAAGATGSVTAIAPSSGGTSWTLDLTAVGPSQGTFNIAVSGMDDVGHSGAVSVPFVINTVPPSIGSVTPNATRFSAQPEHNQLLVTFNSSEALDSAPASLRVTVGQYSMSCGPFQATPPNYACAYSVSGNELAADGQTPIRSLAEESLPITIEAVDAAGNQGSGSGSVTFDFSPPALAAPPQVTYIPASGNVLSAVAAATAGTDVRATFTVTEALGGNPTVASSPGGLGFTLTNASGVSYVYDATPATPGSPANGNYGLTIAVTDLVGNTATLTPATPVAVVNTTPPAAPSTAANGPITYTRIPWGSTATGSVPAFSVSGSAGAVAGAGTVIVYDGANPQTASELGRSTSDATGAFKVDLSRADRAQVFVSAVDTAGNVSIAAPVHDVVWTATFGGKSPGDTLANPHVLVDSQDFLVSGVESPFLGPLSQGSSYAGEPSTYAGVSTAGGQPLVTASVESVWTATASTSGPGVHIAAAIDYDSARGVVVLFGGGSDTGYPSDTWEWSGSTWTRVVAAGESPGSRYRASMVYDSVRGVSVLFGGADANGNALGDMWEWDGIAWTNVIPAGTSPSPRYWHSMAFDAARGVTVLFGGRDGAGNHLGDLWEWNGAAWIGPVVTGTGPSPRDAAGMAYDAEAGVTVLFGGYTSVAPVGDTWTWNGEAWSNPSPTTSPGPLWGHVLAFDSVRGRTVLFGGCTSTDAATSLCTAVTSAVWEWNGQDWTPVTPSGQASPAARYFPGTAFDSQHGVTVTYSGADPAGDILADTWQWNGTAWADVSPGNSAPGARSESAASYDPGRAVTVLFGGCTTFDQSELYCTAIANDTWQWNGTAWSNVTPASSASPSARTGHAMAYDSKRGVTVLIGGESATAVLNDVWDWNGSTWTSVPTTGTSPAGREYHSIAFDPVNNETILFGGDDGNGDLLGDTWALKGSTWTNVTPSGASPSPRTSFGLAYDASRGVTILFGGCVTLDPSTGACTAIASDTWEWNGTDWTNVTPVGVSPGARWDHMMAYDVARGMTELVGGASLNKTYADTWEWDGSTWANVGVNGAGAPARILAAMAYDSARGTTVLFGGEDSTYNLLGDTWLQPSDTGRRAAEIAEFSFGATGATAPSIQQIAMTTTAGAVGNSLVSPGPGAAVNGATLAVWNGPAGGWSQLASNTAGVAAPTTLQYTTGSATEATGYVFGEHGAIDLAVFSTDGRGNGVNPAQVAMGYTEVTVNYQQ